MNSHEAKTRLLLYRPGSNDTDPEIQQAMQAVMRDPALQEWFEGHCVFQQKMREHFQRVEIPFELREQILGQRACRHKKIVRWKDWRILAAAALFVFALGVASLFLPTRQTHGWIAYRERMVRTALRNYRMNLVTRDTTLIRDYLMKNSAPSDYVLPKNLAILPGEGCAILSWQGRKVSMVCMESQEKKDLYLFIINSADLFDAPANQSPHLAQVNKLMTATWSTPDKIYILAGKLDEATLRKYL